jgi:hypothetical protein
LSKNSITISSVLASIYFILTAQPFFAPTNRP